jgi:hypothetical protein
MTREQFEQALDQRRLWLKENWHNGPRWYLVRRNGRTKTWAKDRGRWEVPIKWKLRETLRVGDWNIDTLDERFKVNPGPDIQVGMAGSVQR